MESNQLTYREPIYFNSVAKPIAFEDYKPINYPPLKTDETTTNSQFQDTPYQTSQFSYNQTYIQNSYEQANQDNNVSPFIQNDMSKQINQEYIFDSYTQYNNNNTTDLTNRIDNTNSFNQYNETNENMNNNINKHIYTMKQYNYDYTNSYMPYEEINQNYSAENNLYNNFEYKNTQQVNNDNQNDYINMSSSFENPEDSDYKANYITSNSVTQNNLINNNNIPPQEYVSNQDLSNNQNNNINQNLSINNEYKLQQNISKQEQSVEQVNNISHSISFKNDNNNSNVKPNNSVHQENNESIQMSQSPQVNNSINQNNQINQNATPISNISEKKDNILNSENSNNQINNINVISSFNKENSTEQINPNVSSSQKKSKVEPLIRYSIENPANLENQNNASNLNKQMNSPNLEEIQKQSQINSINEINPLNSQNFENENVNEVNTVNSQQKLKRIKTPILIDPLVSPVPPTTTGNDDNIQQETSQQELNLKNQDITPNILTPDEVKLLSIDKDDNLRDFNIKKHFELSLIKEAYGFNYKKVHKVAMALLAHFEMPQDCEYKSPLLSSEGNYLACIAHGTEDFVYVWDMSDLYWYKYKFSSSNVDGIAFTPDSKFIIIVYKYANPVIYKLENGRKLLDLEGNGEENGREGWQCSFTETGSHFAYTSNKSFTLWSVGTGKIKQQIFDNSPIKIISNDLLICIGEDLNCEIKRISNQEVVRRLSIKGVENPREILDARLSKDLSSFVYVIKQDIVRYIFDDNEYKVIQKFQCGVERATISDDCKYLMKTNMKNISIFDLEKEKSILTILKENFKEYRIDFETKKLVVIDDISINITDYEKEDSIENYVWLNKNPTKFESVKFSRDFKVLLARIDRNNVVAYDLTTGLILKKWHNFDENWIDVAMTSFGGDKIATKSNLLLLKVWNFVSGREEAAFYGYDSYSLCFSANGLYLACGAKYGSEVARIWGINEKKYAVFHNIGSNNNFHTVVHLTSPEPKRLICCATDQQPLIFNSHTRELLFKCECQYRFEEIYEIQSDLKYDVFIIKGRDDKKRNIGLMYKISDGTLLEAYENYTVLELAKNTGVLVSKCDNINSGKLTSTDIKNLNDPILNDFQIQDKNCQILNDNKSAVIMKGDEFSSEYNFINVENGSFIGKIDFIKKIDRKSLNYITVDIFTDDIYFRYFEFLSPQETMVFKKKNLINVDEETTE